MKAYFIRWALAATFAMSLVVAFAAFAESTKPAANAYSVDIKLSRDGKSLATPHLIVVPGVTATVATSHPTNKNDQYRVQVTATPVSMSGAGKAVRVQLMLAEQVEGAWVILGEPSVVAREGKPAQVSVEGGAGRFEVDVNATGVFDNRAVNFQAKSCPAITSKSLSPTTADGVIVPMEVPKCCSVGCTDGSGQTMRCCNAVQCCGCGVCCTNPDV